MTHAPAPTYLSLSELQGQGQEGKKRSIRSVLLLAITKTAETEQEGLPPPVPVEPIPFLATIPSSQEVNRFEHFAGPLLLPIHQCS